MDFEFEGVISGFSEMSDTEKVIAVSKYVADLNARHETEINGYKTTVSKANTEAAGYKRELKAFKEEHLTAEQKAKEAQAEREAYFKEIETKYNRLTYVNSLREAGYSDKNAEAMAEAMIANDEAAKFEIMKAHTDEVRANALADIARNTQRPLADHHDGKDSKPKEIQIAEQLGKQRANGTKVNMDALKKFM